MLCVLMFIFCLIGMLPEINSGSCLPTIRSPEYVEDVERAQMRRLKMWIEAFTHDMPRTSISS